MSPFAFDWVFDHAQELPDAPCVGTPHGWLTYGELAGAIRMLARSLRDEGVEPGSFVILSLPASPAAVAGALAVQSLGGCVVEINRELETGSVSTIASQTGARHAIVHGRDAARWAGAFPALGLRHLHVASPEAPSLRMREVLQGIRWTWLDEHRPASSSPGAHAPIRDAGAPALLVYTSGSTGIPRGVVQTHANIDANTGAICRYLALGPADRALSILPLFYCFGRSVLQTHLHAGGSVFFDHRFLYPLVVMKTIAEQRCTGFYGVPLTFESLRRQVDFRSIPLGSLRYVAQAGGAMHPDTIRWARRTFAPAPLFVMYGQTEATARLSFLPPDRAVEKDGSIGKGLDNVELRVADPAGSQIPAGEVGEVVARGPSITSGYFGAPDETSEILRDGWLRTGDLGWQDSEGFVYLVGRAKDVLKLGGHRVGASEIERVLCAHPAIREAAVVGFQDEGGAEEIAIAFVVPSPGSAVDPADVRRHCRKAMPAFKVPRQVRVVESLPRTGSGKVAKSVLREVLERGDEILEGRAAAGPGTEGG